MEHRAVSVEQNLLNAEFGMWKAELKQKTDDRRQMTEDKGRRHGAWRRVRRAEFVEWGIRKSELKPKLIGSGFRVQSLQPIGIVNNIDQIQKLDITNWLKRIPNND